MLELRWNQEVMNHLIHDPLSMDAQRAWLQRTRAAGDVALCIFAKTSEGDLEFAGTVGLYEFSSRHQRADARIRLSPAHQGKGLAFEAIKMILDYGFNTLNLHKIWADTFSDNAPSCKLYERLGMQSEGVARQHYFHQGKFRDATRFAILRDEFNRRWTAH